MVAKVEATVEEGRAEVGTAVVREAAREVVAKGEERVVERAAAREVERGRRGWRRWRRRRRWRR